MPSKYWVIHNEYFWITKAQKSFKLGFMWKRRVYEFTLFYQRTELVGDDAKHIREHETKKVCPVVRPALTLVRNEEVVSGIQLENGTVL